MTIKTYTFIAITTLTLFKSNFINSQTDSTKLYFQQSFNELKSMLEGKQPMSFEKAVFLSENPYWDNKYAYQDFKDVITYESNKIQKLIVLNNKSDSMDFSVKIDFNAKKHNINNLKYTEQEKREMYRKTLANWAIFKFITDTTNFYNVIHYPFTYQLDDPFGANDWKHSQIMNLFISDEKKGNCLALATLFKLYADRLNTNAYLCTAPQHIYIQHKDIKGDFYNVELATGTHPGDGSIKTLTYTDIEAIANGIALRRLTKPNEYLSLCLINLAKAYEHKFNSKDDNFILQCSELALKHDSLNLNAMLLNAQVLEERVLSYADKHKVSDLNKLKLDKTLSATFKKLEMQLADLNRLGYHQMPLYMQEMILAGLKRKENEKIIVQDKTPNPFPSLKDVAPEDKRYSTLSKGVFEEVHEKKAVEQYGRFKLNVKSKKIVQIVDTSNFQFLIDPVAFAWQIDPLTSKYPYYSPYSAFGNNPILYVDNDGRENIVYVYNLNLMNPQLSKADKNKIIAESQAVVNKINQYYKDQGINIRAAVITEVPTKDKLDKSDVLATIGSVEDHKTFDHLYSDRQQTLPNVENKAYKYDEIGGDLSGNVEATTGSRGAMVFSGDDGDRVAVNSDVIPAYASNFGVSQTDATAYTIIHGVITHTNKITHRDELPAKWEANPQDPGPDVTISGNAMQYYHSKDYVKVMNTVGPLLKAAITRDGAHNTNKPAKVNIDPKYIKK